MFWSALSIRIPLIYLTGVQFRYSKLQFTGHIHHFNIMMYTVHDNINLKEKVTFFIQTDHTLVVISTCVLSLTKHDCHFIKHLRAVCTASAYIPTSIVSSRRSAANYLSTASLEHLRLRE